MNILIIVLVAVISTRFALGSGEGIVDFDKADFVSEANKIRVEVSGMNGPEAKVRVTIGDKITDVDKKYLFGAGELAAESIRLIAESSSPGEMAPGTLADHGFMVSLEFGGTYVHGTENPGGKIKVLKVLRLHFSRKDGLIGADLAVPKGDFSNEWNLYEKRAGQPEDNEPSVTKSVKCPFTTSVEERY